MYPPRNGTPQIKEDTIVRLRAAQREATCHYSTRSWMTGKRTHGLKCRCACFMPTTAVAPSHLSQPTPLPPQLRPVLPRRPSQVSSSAGGNIHKCKGHTRANGVCQRQRRMKIKQLWLSLMCLPSRKPPDCNHTSVIMPAFQARNRSNIDILQNEIGYFGVGLADNPKKKKHSPPCTLAALPQCGRFRPRGPRESVR